MSIRFNNVFYIYNVNSPFASSALNNINLEINDHEFVSIIGHTGSGKSTLVQQINSLLRPTKGKIEVGDFVISADEKKTKGLKKLKKYAGLVFQFPEYQLFEETVLDDVAFGPKNFGDNDEEAKNKAKKALEAVNIDESLFDKSPFELSGGQKRRVAIAGIIALAPSILILDEPTAGLDPQGSKEMMDLFNKIHQQGTTIIMITHDMNNVLKYSSRAIVMSEGEIIYDGKPHALFLKDNLDEKYHIDVPMVIEFAKSLKQKGLKLDIDKIVDVESLIEEIKRCYHG